MDLFATPPRGTALLAVGGYGRMQLSPGSDVDLLLVHDGSDAERAREAFEALLYPLWDAHLRVGHALRTVPECRAAAAERVDSLTALLTGRLLAGSRRLLREVRSAAEQLADADRGAFVDALAEWRMERALRHGAVAESLEPDLKESLGGMRDLQLIRWLTGARGPTPPTGEGFGRARSAGLLDRREWRWAREGWAFVLLVREALHRLTADATNRLAEGHQQAVAMALGYRDEWPREGPVWSAEDALVRDLATTARRAQLATSAALERAREGERARGVEGGSPLVLVRLALGVDASPRAERAGSPRAGRAARRWSDADRAALVDILASGDRGSEWLMVLDAVEVLPSVLPGWSGVRGRPQRDPFHRYPVDVHLFRSAAQMATLLHRPAEPFAADAASLIDNVATPLLGALLHDVGKIGRRSHVRLGVDAAGSVLGRLGVDGRTRDDVLFLVAEHLLLADTATRRDLKDEDLIVRVAATVGDPHRLAMLYLLTMADAVATGPHAVTPWRFALIRELVAKVDRVFARGAMDADRAAAVRAGELAVRTALAGRPVEHADRFLATVPAAYLAWVRPEDAPGHLDLLLPPPAPGEVRMRHDPGRIAGTEVVTVTAPDRLGLLADLAAACALSRLSILSTQVFTTEGGVALDVFEVRTVSGDEADDATWRRLSEELGRVAAGPADDTERRLGRLRERYRRRRAATRVEVRVDADASDLSTVVEVGAPDRLGLLFDLTRTFASHGLDVHAAKVATYGPRVIDVFYVTTAGGEPLRDPAATESLRRALLRAAGG